MNIYEIKVKSTEMLSSTINAYVDENALWGCFNAVE